MRKIIFIGLLCMLGSFGLLYGQGMGGTFNVCPGNTAYIYYPTNFCGQTTSDPTGKTFTWTVMGGTIGVFGGPATSVTTVSGFELSTLAYVNWSQTAGPKSVSVTITGSTCSQTITLPVSLDVPVAQPQTPGAISVSNVKRCAGSNVSLSTNAIANVTFFWEYRISTPIPGPWIPISYTPSERLTNFTLPSPPNTSSTIQFRVYTRYSSCWTATDGTNLNRSAGYGFSSNDPFIPVPPTPTFGICLDGGVGTAYLKSISGPSVYSTYYVSINNIIAIGGITIPANGNEVILSDSRLNDLTIDNVQFYYDYVPPSGATPPPLSNNPSDGCKVDVVLGVPAVTDHTLGFSTTANCTAGLSVSSISGGPSPYTVSIGGAYQTPSIVNFNSLPKGAKVINVKDAYGCVGNSSSLQTYSTLSLNTPSTTPDCPGPQTNGSITLSGLEGNGIYSYSINGVNGGAYQPSGTFSSLPNNTYTVNVKDTNGSGCTYSTTALVGNSAILTLNSVTPQNPSCYGVANGTLTVSASGGTGTTHYSIDNGVSFQDTNPLTGLPSNPYTITIKDDNNCVQTSSPVSIVDPPLITVLSTDISTTPQSCPAKIDGVIKAKASGGTGARQYALEDVPASYVAEVLPSNSFSGLTSGTYTLYVKDGNGCTINKPGIFVPQNPALAGSLGEKTPISCFGKNDGVLEISGVTGGSGPGTYTYLWNPSGSVAGALKSNVGPGNYSATITDANGCTLPLNQTVAEPGVLTLSNTIPLHTAYAISCAGKGDGAIDLTVTGGTAPFTFDWTNTVAGTTPADIEDPAGLGAGTYSVTVTDSHVCGATLNNITLNEPSVLTLGLAGQTNISCNKGSDGNITTLPGGGVSNYLYSLDSISWQSSPSFAGLKAGSYRIRLRDNNDCTAGLPVQLTEPQKLILSLIQQVNTLCGIANGSAQISAAGGVQAYNYTWYNDILNLIGSYDTIKHLAAGSYSAIVQDSHSCKDTLDVFISDSNGPIISVLDKTDLTCFNSNNGSISIGINNGQAPYIINWLINGSPSNQHASTIGNLPEGNQTARVNDVDGCLAFQTVKINAPLPVTVTETLKNPTCVGDSDGEVKLIASGGNPGGYLYAWNNGATVATISSLKQGTYQVHITDSKDCFLDHTSILNDPPPVIIDLGEDRTICVGQKVKLSPGLSGTYLWTSDNGFTSSASDVTLSDAGTYKLIYHSDKNCLGRDELKIITSTDLLKADFLMVAEAHAGDTVVMIDISWPLPENIKWNFPSGATKVGSDGPFAEVIFDSPGEYSITLHTTLGECMDDFTKIIQILEGSNNPGGRISTGNHFIHTAEASPNPMNRVVNVLVDLKEKAEMHAAIVTMDGSRILYTHHEEGSNHYEWSINLPDLSSGLYYLIVRSGNEIKVIRLVKL